MKTQMLAVLVAILGPTTHGRADEHPTKTLDVALREKLQPIVNEWVTAEAQKILRVPSLHEDVARRDIRARFQGQPLSTADEDRLAYLTTMEASQAADRELKDFLERLKAAKPSAQGKPATPPGFQAGQTSVSAPRATSSSGKITFQPSRPLDGSSSIGISGVSIGSGTASNSPNAMQLSPAETQRLQNLTNSRNQLVSLSNNLGRRLPRDLNTQIQDLK